MNNSERKLDLNYESDICEFIDYYLSINEITKWSKKVPCLNVRISQIRLGPERDHRKKRAMRVFPG